MMKHPILCLALLSAAPLFGGITREGDGAVMLDQETRMLSFQLLAKEKLDHFAADGFDAGKEKIMQEMQKNPARYIQRNVARAQMETIFRAEMEKQLQGELDALIQSTACKLNPQTQAALSAAQKATIDERMKLHFPTAFDDVRKTLAEKERKSQIFTAIYPSGKELETLDDAQLAQRLLERFNQSRRQPIMEENRPYLQNEVISPVIAAARKQQKIQHEALDQLRIPQTLWGTDEIKRFIQTELRSATVRDCPEAQANFIEFPSISKKIDQKAKSIVSERLGDALELDAKRYRALLEKEPQRHVTPAMSLERAREVMLPDALQAAKKTIHAPATLTVDHHDPVIRQKFDRAATAKFKSLRDDYAQAQIRRVWPDFDEWLPRLEETELFVRQGEKTLPAVADRPKSDEVLFSETEVKIEAAMQKKFAAESRRLKAQLQAVDDFYRHVTDECRKIKQQHSDNDQSFWQWLFGITPDALTLEKVIEVYEEKVVQASSKPLFPAAKHEIDIRSRAILQLLQKPASKKEVTLQDEEKQVKAFTLVIGGTSDTDGTLQLGSWQAEMSDKQASANAVAAEVKRQIEGQNVSVILAIEVTNAELTYRRVAELREALQELLPDAMVQDSYRK